jgi:putative transposase
MTQIPSISYKRHHFPPQIVAHAAWLYLRVGLSLREAEEMLLQRGIDVFYETIRRWTAKFGPLIARNLRRWQTGPGDVWHLDEVVVKCAGKKFWLWRAVDEHGAVLEEILRKRRNKGAAKRLLIALMKRFGFVPKQIVTDKLCLQGHRSPRGMQRFVSMHSATRNCFSVPSKRRPALTIRSRRLEALDAWNVAAGIS